MTAPTVIRPPIDPRIRARRIAVRRHEGRRRLRRLAVVAVALGLVATMALLTRTPLLDVDRVVVQGAGRTPVTEVLEASGLRTGEPMVGLDLGRARRQVARLPWVADVEVHQEWPGTVRMELSERLPVAVAPAEGGGWLLVDGDGRLLEAVPAPPLEPALVRLEDVPPAEGPGQELSEEAAVALRLARALPDRLVPAVGAVAPVGEGLELRLAEGGVVRLGPMAEADRKLQAVDAVIQRVGASCVGILDVVVPASPVLTPAPGCA